MTSESNQLDFNVIQEFWKQQSLKPENRWTSQSLFDFELEKLQELVAQFTTLDVLDLGSGRGSLSRNLVKNKGTLVAVDNQNSYRDSFYGNPRISFSHSDLESYESSIFFDVILLFGVITQLDIDIEERTLNSISSMLKPDGLAVIKHQCADKESFVFNGFSHELGTNYSARYPARNEQHERLLKYFSIVEEVEYPFALKNRNNSSHVMFICKKSGHSA